MVSCAGQSLAMTFLIFTLKLGRISGKEIFFLSSWQKDTILVFVPSAKISLSGLVRN